MKRSFFGLVIKYIIYNVFNGREYTFFIRKMPLSQYTGDIFELKMDGELKVYSGSNTSILKDSVYIN
ncbi:hypothetical protein [Aliarcobacter skirrowii]|uniref:hypothetical protein n=1 Tax=Aliarcobacter skirrowii TaxID=28200 RepID=UPI0008340003|nr:hypothetical protein [Aliarcobacter skirrowii]